MPIFNKDIDAAPTTYESHKQLPTAADHMNSTLKSSPVKINERKSSGGLDAQSGSYYIQNNIRIK